MSDTIKVTPDGDSFTITIDPTAQRAAEAMPTELQNLGSAITRILEAADLANPAEGGKPYPLSLGLSVMIATAQLLVVAEMYSQGAQRLGLPTTQTPEGAPDALPVGAPEESRGILAAADLLAAFYLRQLPDVATCISKPSSAEGGPRFSLTATARADVDRIVDDFIAFTEAEALQIGDDAARRFIAAQDTDITPDTLKRLSAVIPGIYVMPNNKAVNQAEHPDYATQLMQDGLALLAFPKRKRGRGLDVESFLQLAYEGDDVRITGRRPFTSFDRVVYNAITTLYVAGDPDHTMTPAMVWRAMVGAKDSENPSPQQLNAVTDSIDKMRFMRARIDCSAELARYGATLDGMPISKGIVDTYLLQASAVKVDAGGHEVTAYHVTEPPVLYTYSAKMRQVITVPAKLLDVRRLGRDGKTTGGRIAITEGRLLIRDHLLKRISGMKGDNRLDNHVISLASYERNGRRHIGLYEAAGYSDPTKQDADRVRKYAAQVLDYWTATGYIKGYAFKRAGKATTGIEIKP